MTGNLTDRYIAATIRQIPERQRPEIEKELRAAIEDEIDARAAEGQQPSGAEYAALEGFGDPLRLAASYSHRSQSLIGPELYPSYLRSLAILGWSTLPTIAALLVIVFAAQGKGVWASIFGPLGITATVAVYIAFLVTVLFAVVERSSAGRSMKPKPFADWTPGELAGDDEKPRPTGWGDVATTAIGTLVIVALLLLDRYLPLVTTRDDHPISLLAPALWSLWIPADLVLLAAAIVFEVVKLRAGRWTIGTAVASTILGGLGAASIIATVLTSEVINPAIAPVPVLDPGSWIWWIISILVAVIYLGTMIDAWRPSRQARSSHHPLSSEQP